MIKENSYACFRNSSRDNLDGNYSAIDIVTNDGFKE